jgi:osmotically-inducible protein OsmY
MALCLASLLSACVATPYGTGHAPPQTPHDWQQAADADIARRVRAALLADPRINGQTFTVTVVRGDVQLGGYAENVATRDLALATARRVHGVRSVLNNVVMN